MTRKSKREIERALADLDTGRRRPSAGTPLEAHCDDDVVDLVRQVTRDLLRIRHDHPDRIANASRREGLVRFLTHVRDEYGIDENRDDEVRATLAVASEGVPSWDGVDTFATAPATIARRDPATAAGDLLSELLDAGDDAQAERLLVEATYVTLANADPREVTLA